MPQVILGNYAVTGISSLQFTGGSIFVSEPERGSLITEYSAPGTPQRTIGRLRDTGYEQERDLHLALNAGLPLDRSDRRLLLRLPHRTADVPEVTTRTASCCSSVTSKGARSTICWPRSRRRWPTRRIEDREVPFVQPMIRTAAVDPHGTALGVDGRAASRMCTTRTATRRGPSNSARPESSARRACSSRAPGHILVTPGCYEFDPNRR